MIATGTDVKPLECVFFMRDVRSPQYFEQMKGRGARTIPDADFQAVTPDAKEKARFVLVDAVGVTEHEFVEPPLNRERSISLAKLLEKAANLTITEDETATLASRLAALEAQITPDERAELDAVAGGSLRAVVRHLVDAVDPDAQAAAIAGAADPDEARQQLIVDAVRPLAANPELRARILELRRAHDRVIDEVSADMLLDAHGVVDTSKAKSVVESWRAYLEEHRVEITAIQLLAEARERRVSFGDIKELADRIARPPYNWTPDIIWNAYVALDVQSAGPRRAAPHADRSRLADPLHARRGRHAGPVCRPRRRAVRRVVGPAGTSRRDVLRRPSAGGSTAWCRSSRRRPASAPRTSTCRPSSRTAAPTEPSATSAPAPPP